ncbi:MAG: bifunctional phosphoglucose/phosphomannose isomerase [Armatimonadota bacterium]|nr:bifunctional phosphoglucose/phosphomannose isomerase [Armatimonadota bacterium]MDR7432212.1 bifunctional phosphoglucose/phosphomannose isomerase [Armatimonadota bacterium]MDR7513923.1 bifunctional phosphoglucose/phosphomannose isomerase [Armatimonadota bacterium]MDR7565139.1 bifunctional phosphoglucose/phosphomannose isomerase [Armatimonadota bacterium]MDR7577600.1 bifunctional phosphoglucose/phosphomannose isomerase [Armatimonadota bacterium]
MPGLDPEEMTIVSYVLDDAGRRSVLDPQDMVGLVVRTPEFLREGWELGLHLGSPPPSPRHLLVLGMGGSGIGGDLLRGLLYDRVGFPVTVVKDYSLPAWVGPQDVVFACSYSGNTEETLSAYGAAGRAGARRVAVTSGGQLADRAQAEGIPWVRIPPGLPPRAALGYLLGPMLGALHRWGWTEGLEEEVGEAVAVLRELSARWGPEVPTVDNPAKQLARALVGRLPVVYATSRLSEAAALRWKTQLNENSKVYATWNVFPELNHNETVGWALAGQPEGLLEVVILRDPEDPPRLVRRLEVTREVALGAAGFHEVWAHGHGRLSRVLSLVLFGDLVSVYLAYLNEVDPTPVAAIDELKRRLES